MNVNDKQLREDPWVLEVQQWLNKTYGNVLGFGSVPEDGRTGWDTVYGLIRAVQHELGITELVNNFGETTSALWDQQVTPNLINTYESPIVKLIDGAFRCKGMGNGKFDTVYTLDNDDATKGLKIAAGFENPTSTLDSMWAKALFDMSAFVLVQGGDERTREMQQTLNRKYSEWTGILPCDGIYQRATNTALIYGIQVEIGLFNVANGNFGPATQETYGTLAANHQIEVYNDLVLLIQYALYQNLRAIDPSTASFTGSLDGSMILNLILFQQFMMLTDVEKGYPDLKTMMSLVLSSGSSDRSFEAVDTALQLTTPQIEYLYNYGIKYIGRYLTGTVGNDFVPKYLTREEANYIISKGMAIIPIYQDNNPEVSYYTAAQGISDAKAAIKAATKLGMPSDTIIYFAVDVDALDSDITTNIIPYFQGVSSLLRSGTTGNKYSMGVYGTRNVCTRVSEEVGAVASYVSNMSTGWSGNLGFSQPTNWTFDQFAEPTNGIDGIFVDQVAVSHNDSGVVSLDKRENEAEKALLQSMGWDILNKKLLDTSYEFDKEQLLVDYGAIEVSGVSSTKISDPDPSMLVVNFNNGTPEIEGNIDLGDTLEAKVISSLGGIGGEISAGRLSFGLSSEKDNLVLDMNAVIEDEETSSEKIEVSQGFTVKIDMNKISSYVKTLFGKLWEFIKENYLAMLVIGAVFGLAILSGVTLATIVSVLATAFGYILEVMSI